MKKLVIIRHGESEWNQKNLFTGWVDVELSDKGKAEAKRAGQLMKEAGLDFDVCYTSYLKRAINTQQIALKEMEREWLPVIKSEKYGDDQVHIWRRSFDVRPPMMEDNNPYSARKNPAYRDVPVEDVPMCESLKDTIARTVPYFENEIKPLVMEGKRVFIAAHGNSLRSLIKYFENISDEEIINVEIPTGTPLVYEFDDDFKVINKYYLK